MLEPRRPPRFGDAHTYALTSDLGLAYARTSYSGTDRGVETFTIAPGFDWFIADRWSLGLAFSCASANIVGFDPRQDVVDTKRSTVGIAGRVGVDVRTSETVSVYPRVALGYGLEKFSSLGTSSLLGVAFSDYSREAVFVSISVPALVHVAGHFFLGAGPYISTDVSATVDGRDPQNRATAVGLTSVVGGWL